MSSLLSTIPFVINEKKKKIWSEARKHFYFKFTFNEVGKSVAKGIDLT